MTEIKNDSVLFQTPQSMEFFTQGNYSTIPQENTLLSLSLLSKLPQDDDTLKKMAIDMTNQETRIMKKAYELLGSSEQLKAKFGNSRDMKTVALVSSVLNGKLKQKHFDEIFDTASEELYDKIKTERKSVIF